MIRQSNSAPFSERQLRVGELIKQSLGQIFLRDEAKVPSIETKNITLLINLHTDIKRTETNLKIIKTSHTKEANILQKEIDGKQIQFDNFYKELDLLGVDLSKVDEIIEKT